MDWLNGLAWPQITSTVGLTLDIVGVVMLIGTGLPSKKIRETAVTQLFDEAMARRYDRWAWCGAFSIVAGFVLQITGMWMQKISGLLACWRPAGEVLNHAPASE